MYFFESTISNAFAWINPRASIASATFVFSFAVYSHCHSPLVTQIISAIGLCLFSVAEFRKVLLYIV